MLHAFIYYRIPPESKDRDLIKHEVLRLLSTMKAYSQHVALQQRADDRDTWMEVYSGVTDRTAFEEAMAHALPASLISFARAIEWFIDQDA